MAPWTVLASMAFAGVPGVRAENEPPVVHAANMTLADALALAMQHSVTLKQAQADVSAAAAAARGAAAPTKPSLSATTYATAGDSSNILNTSPGVAPVNIFSAPARGFVDQNLTLMFPLSSGGKLRGVAGGARRQSDAAILTAQADQITVKEIVTERYADALLQRDLVSVAQSRLTAEDEQVRVTSENVQTGKSAPVDLLREQAEQADAGQQLLSARNQEALALVSLKTALGVSQESDLTLTDTLDTLSPPASLPGSLHDALAQAEKSRPEVAAAQRQIEAAQSALGAAHGAYAPQVYGVAMADAMAGQGTGRTGYTIGLTASLPLLDGGQRRADTDAAKAKLDRAAADALQVRQTVDQDAASAWLAYQTAMAQLQAARVGETAAVEADKLADLRYHAGKSVLAERLDAASAMSRALGARARAEADVVVSRARLLAAVGALAISEDRSR